MPKRLIRRTEQVRYTLSADEVRRAIVDAAVAAGCVPNATTTIEIGSDGATVTTTMAQTETDAPLTNAD